METNHHNQLVKLIGSDFKLTSGEPHIIDWQVEREGGAAVGTVIDLLFDPETRAVRYLIIDLKDSGMNLDHKKVMIPIGIAHLHEQEDKVVLPNIHLDQFIALPDYSYEEINPQTESYIRQVIGSPAALRLEEQTAQIDQEQFYLHQHFDSKSFYTKGGDSSRIQEQKNIHDLIENAKKHKLETIHTVDGQVLVQGTPNAAKPWLDQEGRKPSHSRDDHSDAG